MPSRGARAASTRSTTEGRAPATSTSCTANIEVPRAMRYAPTVSATSAKPMRSERPDGRILASGSPSETGPLGSGRTAVRDVGGWAAGTQPSSVSGPEALQRLADRRELEAAQQAHFVLELDAELFERPPAGLGHKRQGLGRAGVTGVLDEVRMPGRDLRAADAVTSQPARLEHSARGELVIRVLEDASEGALVRRLCGLPAGLEVGDFLFDLFRGLRLEPELGAGDHLAGSERRTPILEPELLACAPLDALRRHDEGPLEDLRPIAPVGAGVHLHPASDRARNRAGELEASQAGRASPV